MADLVQSGIAQPVRRVEDLRVGRVESGKRVEIPPVVGLDPALGDHLWGL